MQRALFERDKRKAEFTARLQHAPLADQQRVDNTAARQLLEVRTDLPPDLRPYERQIAAREADALVLLLPPPVVRIEVPEMLRPRVVEQLERPWGPDA